MKIDEDIDKVLDAVIDIASQGVPIQAIIRSLIKNQANTQVSLNEIRKEFEQFKALINEEDDDE
jgi:transposase-like protein